MNEAVQFQRQWRLCQRLSSLLDGESLADLADRYEVSTKTIQRDIATLRAVGLEVVEATEKFGLKRWRVEPDTTRMPNFSWDEAVSIYLGRRFLEPLAGTIFWEAAHPALSTGSGGAILSDEPVNHPQTPPVPPAGSVT